MYLFCHARSDHQGCRHHMRVRRRAALAAGLLAIVLPTVISAATASAGTVRVSSRQEALAEYNSCKPLKVLMNSGKINPLKASAAQLRANGFPPKPPAADKQALSEWTLAVRKAHFQAPTPVCGSKQRFTTIDSSNWVGHYASESTYGSPILDTNSEWVQPSVPPNSNYTNYQTAPQVALWTGTGLVNIIQTGCSSIATSPMQVRCWTEDYPAGPVYEGPVVNPGDIVLASDAYIGSNEALYVIENVTTGATQSFVNAAPNVGLGSADYIAERTCLSNGTGLYLPDFGSSYVSYNDFELENGAVEELGGNTLVEMASPDGTLRANAGSLSSGNFYQYWDSAGPNSDCTS
jgi:hypothetical protein